MMVVRASSKDISDLACLSVQLWQENELTEMAVEFMELLSDENAALFLAVEEKPVGFAQCQLRRDYVEGTQSSPVGYLEGIYIDEAYRNRGYARALLAACENWAREKGCSEFASDCELGNEKSLAFHLELGFEESNRIICFSKKL